MKALIKGILMLIVALGFWACKDEPDSTPKMLDSDMNALREICRELNMEDENYPIHWDLDNPTTWKGIELDTVFNPETEEEVVVVKSITLYLVKPMVEVPVSLNNLSYLYDLKIFGCPGSFFDGRRIPDTVRKLLVDRIDSETPGYIQGVLTTRPSEPSRKEVCLNYANYYEEITIHGVEMPCVGFNSLRDAKIDLSDNTLDGELFHKYTSYLTSPANLSHNRFSSLDGGWSYWIGDNIPRKSVPNLQYNDFCDIPDYVFGSDFWKEYHENFIGNPGYKAPEQ